MPSLLPPLIDRGRLGGQPQPTLTSDELTVRPWRAEDAAALVEAYQDPAIQRWHLRSVDPAEAGAMIEATHSSWQSESRADWAISDGRVVGRVALNELNLYEGVAQFGYWTLPAARGRRVAVRGVLAVTDWVFAIGFHRLILRHSTENEASCRVALKAGFEYEGTQRRDGRHADGWHDMHLHARLAPDQAGSAQLP